MWGGIERRGLKRLTKEREKTRTEERTRGKGEKGGEREGKGRSEEEEEGRKVRTWEDQCASNPGQGQDGR